MGANGIIPSTSYNGGTYDVLTFLMNPPTCEVIQTVAQSIPHAGTIVNFDAELIDTDGMHSTVSNTSRITAQTPGRYMLWGGIGWSPNGTNTRGAWLLINGVAVAGTEILVQASTTASSQTTVPLRTKTVYLNAGDYIEVFGYQSSGAPLNTFVTGQSNSHFGARWIAAS